MKQYGLLLAIAVLGLLSITSVHAQDEARTRPPRAELYFVSPQANAKVTSPVTVRFGLRGMGVAPAGIDLPNTGHHHLLVDMSALPDLIQPLPATDNVRHFGKGQTETQLELAPGEHTLQLLLGDYVHRPHAAPLLSERITIYVQDSD